MCQLKDIFKITFINGAVKKIISESFSVNEKLERGEMTLQKAE